EAAAQLYFGRHARYLSLGQAAVLAAVPRGPSAYNPYKNGDRLRERKEWILGRMAKLELIDAAACEHARGESLDLQAFDAAFRAPHFVDYLAAHLDAWGLSGATEIRTTLDPRLQESVVDLISQELNRLQQRRVGS